MEVLNEILRIIENYKNIYKGIEAQYVETDDVEPLEQVLKDLTNDTKELIIKVLIANND